MVNLLGEIKGELQKGYPLQRFAFNAGSWNNVGLDEFLIYPEEHYLQIIKTQPRREISKQDLIENIDALYALLEKYGHVKRSLRISTPAVMSMTASSMLGSVNEPI